MMLNHLLFSNLANAESTIRLLWHLLPVDPSDRVFYHFSMHLFWFFLVPFLFWLSFACFSFLKRSKYSVEKSMRCRPWNLHQRWKYCYRVLGLLWELKQEAPGEVSRMELPHEVGRALWLGKVISSKETRSSELLCIGISSHLKHHYPRCSSQKDLLPGCFRCRF